MSDETKVVWSGAAFLALLDFKLNLSDMIIRHLKALIINREPDSERRIFIRAEDVDTAFRNGVSCPACRMDLLKPRPPKSTFLQRLRRLFKP